MAPGLMKLSFSRITLFSSALILSFSAQAENHQQVTIQGVASNTAIGIGSRATMNIASTQGVPVGGSNRQVAHVKGAVINSAVGAANAELNIASKTPSGGSGNQAISVGGAIVNQASGAQTSIVNIGSR